MAETLDFAAAIFISIFFLASAGGDGGISASSRVISVNFVGYVGSRDRDSRQTQINGLLEVDGAGVADFDEWRVTTSGRGCGKLENVDYFEAFEVKDDDSGRQGRGVVQILLPTSANVVRKFPAMFICVKTSNGWIHTGQKSIFRLPEITDSLVLNGDLEGLEEEEESNEIINRQERAVNDQDSRNSIDESDSTFAQIFAVRLTSIDKAVLYDGDSGIIQIREGAGATLNVFGTNLNQNSSVMLISAKLEFGEKCVVDGVQIRTGNYPIEIKADNWGVVTIPEGTLLTLPNPDDAYYFCLSINSDAEDPEFFHQGGSPGLRIEIFTEALPIWLSIVLIVILLCLSGLFSGLNLGLMALDQTELKIVQNTGDEKEQRYANKIFPVRAHGNFLLCSLLLGNVLVNNTMTILLDKLTSGVVAIIGSTMGIVIFGEIVPQSICSRHALAVGANTIWITKFFMGLTFVLSYPISKILDKILGDEIGTVYDKKKLIELLKVTNENNDLERDEVDIVTGALKYKEKTVKHIMTGMADCYMLHISSVLNFETVSDIREQGYSRIPVYDGERNNIVHILFAKDLMFIDPDDNMPLAMVCEFYNNDVNFVFHDTPLNVMFNEFKSGEKGHMAFVQDVNTSGEGDPFYETIGLVTLEDIIEEIIQQEIVDETDVVIDNRTKKRRKREKGNKDSNFPVRAGDGGYRKVKISQQLTLAVFQYLTTSIEPFKSGCLAEVVLKKLLTLDIYREIKYKKKDGKIGSEEDLVIIHKGKAINFFILIIEGRVQVNIGREELMFESGPFSYFGIQTLSQVTQSMDGIESPSSPVVGPKSTVLSATSMHSVFQEPVSSLGPRGEKLGKMSTHNCLETVGIIPGKRGSIDFGHSRQGSGVNFAPFVPDYTVKAASDVLYVKVTRATYIRALKASMMTKKQSNTSELMERELDNFLDRVNEDDMDGETAINTPILRSPEGNNRDHLDHNQLSVRRESAARLPASNHSNKKHPGPPWLVSKKEAENLGDPEKTPENQSNSKFINGPILSSERKEEEGPGSSDSPPPAAVILVNPGDREETKESSEKVLDEPEGDEAAKRTSLLSREDNGAS